jgi:hypothetical protein
MSWSPISEWPAESARLGEPEAVFRLNEQWQLMNGLFLLGVAGMIAFLASTAISSHEFFLGILCLILFGIALPRAWRLGKTVADPKQRILLYDHGFVYLMKRRFTLFPWDRIDVWQNLYEVTVNLVPAGRWSEITVRRKDGEELFLKNEIQRIRELANAIQNGVARSLFPRVVQALDQGKVVEFGPFTLDRQTLQYENNTIGWADLGAVNIKNGAIRIEKRGGWITWAAVPIAKVPNAYLYLTVVNHFARLP